MTTEVRLARGSDVAGLSKIRYEENPAIHADRIGAEPKVMRYFVAELQNRLVGFALLILSEPRDWTDAHKLFPLIVDVFVAEEDRRRGIGRKLIYAVEQDAHKAGCLEIYLSVEPEENEPAMRLYERLGYERMQNEPYDNDWSYVDSTGKTHTGHERLIDMKKRLQ
ncbi:MAG: GNAT family N-acetyltransferase [Anaerolineae bacterium]|nr:GNAT family N-acetyltransferase [Anaerolineae bacterium]